MSEPLKQPPSIKAFPNDNVKRVVWWYGAVYKNASALSTTPLVDVALREIINFENNELGGATVVKIGLPQLDIVRLGTIWVGQHNTGTKWDNYNGTKTEPIKFEFDCSSPMIESINILDSKPDTDTPEQKNYTIPAYKYNLQSIDKETRYPFFNSKITKLLSVDNCTVLIPALELLTSTYTPKGQDIRCDLFSHSIDEALALHLDLEQSTGNVDGTYNITLKKDRHDTNIAFLAYLRCNHVSRSRASKIWSCLATKKTYPNGVLYYDHYPEIFPYHPKKLKLECDGLRLNDQTFLVFRINKYSIPDEHLIYPTTKEKGRSKGNIPQGDDLYVPPEYTVDADLPVTSEVDPGNNTGVAYITSEVTSSSNQSIIRQHAPGTDFENNANIQSLKPNTSTQLSSGDKNSSIDCKNTAKLKQYELEKKQSDREHIIQSEVIDLVRNALAELVGIRNSSIQSIKYLDENTEQYNDFKLASFPEGLFRKNATWSASNYESFVNKEGQKRYKFTPRKFLLAKITLKNATSAYLLEIDRKSSKTGFSGLIFNVPLSILSSYQLYVLLKTISKNKGTFRKRDGGKLIDIKLPVSSYHIYDHSLIENSMAKKMAKVIKIAEEKGVFLARH
ncbi:hypothetical protein B0F87_11724 [Methylobacter tundripaludum]|uniref:TnsE C-terminal domain-containing protein n=1 Tax=Methylobacter tundripaludum TaxID=173365 RepID=A0A2S6H530_9GAMM|nr:hypothetical protein [Methylobacter tundripaludum]PPK72541.1 hypothetical protein B0F87_11724 [Methylobacter tundripaludum]